MSDISSTSNPFSIAARMVIDGISGSSRQAAPQHQSNMASLISGSLDSATISTTSKQLGALYNELGNIADPESAAQAKAAFRNALMDQISSPASGGAMDFVVGMTQLAENDATTFQNTFITAASLNGQGMDSRSFLDTVVRLEESDLQRAFVNETDNIVNNQEASSVSRQAVYDQFITTVSNAINNSAGTNDYSSTLSNLFEQLGQQNTLQEKSSFMEQYQEENK